MERPVITVDDIMTIDSAAQLFFGIVHVQALDPFDADDVVKLLNGGLVVLRLDQWITRRKHVTRIDANPQPFRFGDSIDNPCQVFEAMPNRRALAGGGLQE